MSDVKYVEELIGPETVTSMTRQGVAAFIDHGRVALTLEDDVEAAEGVLEGFRRCGVDYDTLTGHVEKTGIRDFGWSFGEMLRDLEAVRAAV